MSNPNENLKSRDNTDKIDIDEAGKVVINDPELAKMTEELSSEELDAVAGGLQRAADGNLGCDSGC